jgi:hypothetical protein
MAMLCILTLNVALATSSRMCNLCVSFLDASDRSDLSTVRSSLMHPKGNCQKACLNMKAGKDMINCALLCEQTGSETFASLLDISDYAASTEMCSLHQACERKEPEDSAVAFLETQAMTSNSSKAKPGNVTINGDMTVTGALKTKSIRSSALTVNGSITVTHAVRTEFLKADNTKAAVLETSTVSSPTGSVQLTGNLALGKTAGGAGGSLSADSIQTESLIQLGVKQWQLLHHDNFEGEEHGWKSGESFMELSSVEGNSFLGGHCKSMANGQVTKKFDLPEHSNIRVQARYHFLDSWEGESAFLKVDDKYAWMDSVDSSNSQHGINIAGGAHPEHKFGHPVDVVIPHSAPSVFLTFGSNLDEHACDESFGVDDVMISIQ